MKKHIRTVLALLTALLTLPGCAQEEQDQTCTAWKVGLHLKQESWK